eukprot:6173950-Pleurochrysis_carterae.AAC.3
MMRNSFRRTGTYSAESYGLSFPNLENQPLYRLGVPFYGTINAILHQNEAATLVLSAHDPRSLASRKRWWRRAGGRCTLSLED